METRDERHIRRWRWKGVRGNSKGWEAITTGSELRCVPIGKESGRAFTTVPPLTFFFMVRIIFMSLPQCLKFVSARSLK